MMEFVTWDDDIHMYELENKIHVSNHQADDIGGIGGCYQVAITTTSKFFVAVDGTP